MKLQSIRRQAVPLHAEVAAMLRHRIMSRELPAGARLPALSELTEKLGVARMTVKQAMDSLEDEGLIERHAGRGTFVREIDPPRRHTLRMRADISELQSMVSQLRVSMPDGDISTEVFERNGRRFLGMKRIHTREATPFCLVDLKLDSEIFALAPERFAREIVVAVLEDIGIGVATARQRVTISYADFELAQALEIPVNSPVFRVLREFFDTSGRLIYFADLIYPGDLLAFEIEFAINRKPPARGAGLPGSAA